MAEPLASPQIDRLIQMLARLPGLGPRSARKAALHLIKRRELLMAPLAEALQAVMAAVVKCSRCGSLDTLDPCGICRDPKREPGLLVVVEDVGDVWALERAGVIKGRYLVLGGALSPLDGVRPEDLNLALLEQRLVEGEVREVLLALNATVEGQATAHYVSELIARRADGPTVSRLAHGVPIGGELDYLDEGTLAAAVKARRSF
ncbi:MAG: recombination protein RecR [Rhizobiales bacterium]|nr:recombination protein RecR [Hyphomicrobiales bacterium]